MQVPNNDPSTRFVSKRSQPREAGQAPYESARSLTQGLGATGKDIGVAIIDSGVFPHPHHDDALVASVVLIPDGAYDSDTLGHGTHVAGIVHDVAPDAKIISLQVVNGQEAQASTPEEKEQQHVRSISSLMSALDWIVEHKSEYNIRVANLSTSLFPLIKKDESGVEYFLNPIDQAVKRCVDAGITLVTAAGNLGDRENSLITYPAACPEVITVGASDTRGTASPDDDVVAPFSSRGPTIDGLIKPDLLAPGVSIMATASPGSAYQREGILRNQLVDSIKQGGAEGAKSMLVATKMGYMDKQTFLETKQRGGSLSAAFLEKIRPYPMVEHFADGTPALLALDGTSQASPIVTGVVAAMLEANPSLTPAQIKELLQRSAHPMSNVAKTAQGAGVLNGQRAVELAREMGKHGTFFNP